MKIEMKDLRERPVDLEFSWPPRELELEDPDFRFVGEARGRVHYTLVGERVLAKGQVQVQVETSCVRCLKTVELPLTAEVDVVYEQDPELLKDEFELLAPSDDVTVFFDGESLDPMPELREAVMSELPSFPVCSVDCQGLCPRCGADLNAGPCGCSAIPEDPANSWKTQIRKLKLDKK